MKDKMPVLFVGHGSPMNAIEDNKYSRKWNQLGKELPRPEVILCISAHWYNKKTNVNDTQNPRMIYDMYGFPKPLYDVKYPAVGSDVLAHEVIELLTPFASVDNSWGIDHGTWSVLVHMYPKADIPLVQLSIDSTLTFEEHYELGKKLSSLREKKVLILGSGNVVHNLGMVSWETQGGFPWAYEFDNYVKEAVLNGNHEDVMDYKKAGDSAKKAFYSPDHYIPLLYILGASSKDDKISVFNDDCVLGSLSMTGYLFE